MAKKNTISIARLKECVTYYPETGKFFWKGEGEIPNPECWHARIYGLPAFTTKNRHGYFEGRFSQCSILAHHAAYAFMTGSWPVGCMDHIDGNPENNSWGNLREATVAQNNRNRKGNSGHKFVGVHWNKSQREWRAEIQIGKRKIFLGSYGTEKDAAIAFDYAAVRRCMRFNRLNFPERRSEYEAYLGPIGRGSNGWMLDHYVE